MQHVIQLKEFFPSYLVYGFVGKHPDIAKHAYREHKDADANRAKLLKILGSNHSSISLLKQVHGVTCPEIKSLASINYACEADAQITKNPDIILAVQTADCTPVLLVDPKEKIVAAIHAGWKGALGGVIASTVKKMKALGTNPSDLVALIGPCIRQPSYEVSKEFLDPFLLENAKNSKFFKKSKTANKYLFDLPGYVKSKLRQDKIKTIYDTEIDTLKDQSFYSYRRACLAQEPLAGHNISMIGLKRSS
jgi:hypothetical protein